MKIRNTAAVIAAIATVATIQSAQAAFTDTLADLVANGGSLTIDDKTFSGFSFVNTGLTSFDASSIIVTASQVGDVDYLTWSGNISLASTTIATADLKLNYIVAANPGSINMIDQSYTGSALNGALAVDETVSTGGFGGTIVANSHLQVGDLSDPPGETGVIGVTDDSLVVNPAQHLLYVTKDIALAALPGTPGIAAFTTISQVSQSFHQVAVPEPTTVIAGALLLLPFGVSTLRIMRKNRIS